MQLEEYKNTRRALRLLHSDVKGKEKKSEAKMGIKHLRYLALGILNTLNNLNPRYMKEIFSKTTYLTYPLT